MKRALLIALLTGLGVPAAHGQQPARAPGTTLRPFTSEQELARFHRRIVAEHERHVRREPPPPPPPPAPPAPAAAPGSAPPGESITNVQHAGVDEGGIVKLRGQHLVILRRGRLFTVRVGDDALQPVSSSDAFGPGIDPRGSWYDEMLVAGNDVVVIGYSYASRATEVGVFRLDEDGKLSHRATYHMRSSDYYSSRNYASRLVGGKLVFYAPIWVRSGDLASSLPAMRRWGGADSTFKPTVAATRVYRPAGPLRVSDGLMLHGVTVCDLRGEGMDCQSTALFGPVGRVFYVSPTSVYVWTTQRPAWYEDGDRPGRSLVYRMPLDGTAPTGLRVAGSPVDQFSFLESGDGQLNVLVRADGSGDGMWGAERTRGDVALLRVPLRAFGDGSRAAAPSSYRWLPTPGGGAFHNRFVGDWLLYGTDGSYGAPKPAALTAVRWAGGGEPVTLPVTHHVERIEAMGAGAVVVGSAAGDLFFSGVRLGSGAALAGVHRQPGVAQAESRSHGFFYRADGAASGLLGLPVWRRLPRSTQGASSVLFLRNQDLGLTPAGVLAADSAAAPDDGCLASCTDWYGNARPIFLRGRILALMGYQLVEGVEVDGAVRERRRVTFAPHATGLAGAWHFTSRVGQSGGRILCQGEGSYAFTVREGRLDARYHRRERCSVDGAATTSADAGVGTGTLSDEGLQLTLDRCRMTGRLISSTRLQGRVVCSVALPDGTRMDVPGEWSAVRA